LFTGAKLAHLAALPQGQPERRRRALSMVRAMDAEGFGGCSLHGECAAVCPKRIELSAIARLSREWLSAALRSRDQSA
jgi:succinate dehydrogenase / fumarate reductase iron-sulfur subunit